MRDHAHIIVLGNEKGGTGKSTMSMHLIVALLQRGLSVGSLDLDARQGTLSRYLQNRGNRTDAAELGLSMPEHVSLHASDDPYEDEDKLYELIEDMGNRHDVMIIDTPGSDHYLSRLGHSFADTLISPLNDSLIDLDVIGRVDPRTQRVQRPSHYAEMVWETKKVRALRGEKPIIDWIVLRNRLATLESRNNRDMEKYLADLARRIGFRVAPGLSERVIFRSLFLEGLTLLDLRRKMPGFEMSMSHVAARQELRQLLDAIGLDQIFGIPTKPDTEAGTGQTPPSLG